MSTPRSPRDVRSERRSRTGNRGPSRTDRVLFGCQAVPRAVVDVDRVLRRARRRVAVVGLFRVREWLGRRAGVSGCEPAALATESFPGCPPGPVSRVEAFVAAAA